MRWGGGDVWQGRPSVLAAAARSAGNRRRLTSPHLSATLHPSCRMPDDVVFVKEIPHTATGKISKLTLRQQFAGHRLRRARL